MDDRVICRAMLYSYKDLENRCKRIDIYIYNTAIHSAFRNTMETYNEIEQLTREKIAYINVKVIIDQALATLKRTYELVQHNIKGVSIAQLASTLNTSELAIISRVRYQKEKLCKAILSIYNAEELLDIICDSEWLMKKYKRELKRSPQNEN